MLKDIKKCLGRSDTLNIYIKNELSRFKIFTIIVPVFSSSISESPFH